MMRVKSKLDWSQANNISCLIFYTTSTFNFDFLTSFQFKTF